MSIHPLRPLQAAPLLPAVLARIARTPTARLALVFRLIPAYWCATGKAPRVCPPCAPPERPGIPITAIGDEPNLGEAIYVDTLVAGSIIGTPLALGCATSGCGGQVDIVV